MDPRLITPTPAGLDGGRPRAVRLAPAGRALVVVIAALFLGAPIAGIVLNRVATDEREVQRLIDASPAVSDGTVTRLWRPSKDSKQPKVAYTFVDGGGQTRQDEAKISPARWNALRVGDRLPIRFVETNPALNLPDGTHPRVIPFFFAYFVSGFLAFIGVLSLHPLRREWHLLSEGRAARAIVKEHFKQQTQHGTQRSMRYEFALLSGASTSGKCGTGKTPPAIGSIVWVLYDPERPQRNRPYPLALVQLGKPANS
jgi:hypothetical protein